LVTRNFLRFSPTSPLSYIRLGQSATTLSGGEAQRIKLARELSKRGTGSTLYILDEPTTGLHFQDIKLLLSVLTRLRDQGNTIIIIEHNLDVIKSADWIIDLGPEGGHRGGKIIATGTPETVAAEPNSYTGQFLKKISITIRTGCDLNLNQIMLK
jgi:excinuclease ABC subunit A